MKRRPGLCLQVVAYHEANPLATASDIAQALNTSEPYVRATARRRGLLLTTVNHTRPYLRKEALARGLRQSELIERLLGEIERSGLVAAILDDEDAFA